MQTEGLKEDIPLVVRSTALLRGDLLLLVLDGGREGAVLSK